MALKLSIEPLASCVPSKRRLESDFDMLPVSKVTVGPSDRIQRDVSSIGTPKPLGDVETNTFSLDSVYDFTPSSELSPIQEEPAESSGSTPHKFLASDPRVPDSEPNTLPFLFDDGSLEWNALLSQPTPPEARTPSVQDTESSLPAPLEPAQLTPTSTPATPIQSTHSVIPDDNDEFNTETSDASSTESSSVFEEDTTSTYTASLLSEAEDFTYENGRRYHSYREGTYVLPNDEPEQDRQDLLHHVRNLVLHGRLFHSPLEKNIQRVLDIGTGTGIWAIDVADSLASAQVIGIDLSPIQPAWVPPNCRFIVDDAEAEWLYSRSQPFDFIHARDMGGAIADWPRLLAQSFQHLRPGGWIELCEFEVMLQSDDDSIALAPTLCEFLGHLDQASARFNRPMNIAQHHRRHLIEAGFEEVRDKLFKVPSSTWPTDPLEKEIGKYNLCSLLLAVESYSLALFTRVLGWSNERTQVFLAGVRHDLKNPNVHTYCNLHVVYGRKPSHQ
ncbi:uncharacterized protein N7506_001334 [Penicillium brevicompactum]|uniref:uncharacterized protein n=1 Tax=Penicillium brevicompactum TaxID=5074 RepID=UPI0025410407|nr:uncharacterized protein N7506_001334 [Penicillium brevicompactum]KAJ5348081.1 hypothetical protein N7506_001334 [Penicillium brevicompactum]